jgi:hypothetical protein
MAVATRKEDADGEGVATTGDDGGVAVDVDGVTEDDDGPTGEVGGLTGLIVMDDFAWFDGADAWRAGSAGARSAMSAMLMIATSVSRIRLAGDSVLAIVGLRYFDALSRLWPRLLIW